MSLIWQENYNKLKTFIEQYKRYPSKKSTDPHEKSLGLWRERQRAARYGKSNSQPLTEEQIKLLEQLPLSDNQSGFRKADFKRMWFIHYNKLKDFVVKNNRLPSKSSSNADEKKLYSWSANQRQKKEGNNRSSFLAQEQIELLEQIPGWFWFHDNQIIWMNRYNKLKDFIMQNDRLPIRTTRNKEESLLYSWCANQRQEKKSNNISEGRIKLLEQLPHWYWMHNRKIIWLINYNKLKDFVKQHNKLPAQRSKDPNERKLSFWCSTIRTAKKSSKHYNALTEEQIKLLEQIPGWFWNHDPKIIWLTHYNELKDFIMQNDRLPILSDKFPEEETLSRWCVYQRSCKKKHQFKDLSEDQIKLLEQLPHWSWTKYKGWQDSYNEVKTFIEKNHRLPSISGENPQEKTLYRWCSKQRDARKTKSLTEEQFKQLEQLPGWFWQIDSSHEWHQKFTKLKDFITTHRRKPSSKSSSEEERSLFAWLRRNIDKDLIAERDEMISSLLSQLPKKRSLSAEEEQPAKKSRTI